MTLAEGMRHISHEVMEVMRKAKVVNLETYKRKRRQRQLKKHSSLILSVVLLLFSIGVCYLFKDDLVPNQKIENSKAIEANYQQMLSEAGTVTP